MKPEFRHWLYTLQKYELNEYAQGIGIDSSDYSDEDKLIEAVVEYLEKN